MVVERGTSGIGQRVAALRKARGYKASRDLAAAMPGSNITASVLENLESGRKADVSVSLLLNIARALRIPPSYLLAPVTQPQAALDLPNLSDEMRQMTAGEFEAWFSGVLGGEYRSPDAAERLDLQQLDAYRTTRRLRRELVRQQALESVLDAETAGSPRVEQIQLELDELETYLRDAGWDLD